MNSMVAQEVNLSSRLYNMISLSQDHYDTDILNFTFRYTLLTTFNEDHSDIKSGTSCVAFYTSSTRGVNTLKAWE